jgi:hypothetical protein
LIWIINMGRGLPVSQLDSWQDPLPGDWPTRFKALKFIISNRRIHYAGLKTPSRLDRLASINPVQLLQCEDFGTPGWDWLHAICTRWAAINGVPLRSSPAGPNVSMEELHPWLADYVESHKHDAKKPRESEIHAAAIAAFNGRSVHRAKVLRPVFDIVRPKEWNRRGRKPRNSA